MVDAGFESERGRWGEEGGDMPKKKKTKKIVSSKRSSRISSTRIQRVGIGKETCTLRCGYLGERAYHQFIDLGESYLLCIMIIVGYHTIE